MHFVATRAEFRNLFAHEGLQENAAMWLRVQARHEIVQAPDHRIAACRQRVELWIFQQEIALAHGALHIHDAVAHHAAQTSPGFGLVDVLRDGLIHHAAEQQCRIVAASAPFGRLHAIHFLHVLNAFAVPLIVERGKMMNGTLPLLVNVRMAAFAGLGLQKIV
jgi:hypothetical protein